jgi:DNA-binding CsgD family transcriptional regulator
MVDHDFMAQAYGSTALAQCQLEQGRPRAAAATAREAFRVFHMHGRLLPAHEAGWTAAISLALVGDVAEAGKVLDDTDALGGELASGAPRRHEVEAWIAAAAGDLRGARRLLAEAAEELTRVGDLQHAAAALHGIVRLGYANVAADRLTALALEMDGDFVRTRALHATALAAHDTRRLEHVAEVFATMGANLYAAEAHAAAAVDHRRDGRAREGASAARRAAAFAARCEGAITPALLGVEGRVRLTPAELETANLAAAGHSNREIAEMLVVSLRTVENRLYRIYEKLGVSGRDDLARALRES